MLLIDPKKTNSYLKYIKTRLYRDFPDILLTDLYSNYITMIIQDRWQLERMSTSIDNFIIRMVMSCGKMTLTHHDLEGTFPE